LCSRRYTTKTGIIIVPIPVPTISDREFLFRSAIFGNDREHSYIEVGYNVEDERRPVGGGRVRVESLAAFIVKEAAGTEGEGSEVWRAIRFNPMFQKGLGFFNSFIASKATEILNDPLKKIKLDVERLVKEYKPPEHVVEELELTWKGGPWRMALEAALGVQYLHHHRYERRGAKEKRTLAASLTPPSCSQVLE
jgi:hypothetical protein